MPSVIRTASEKKRHGIDSQEQRCRQYAKIKGYSVQKIFLDEGVSGGLFERPAMIQLIDFLDKNIHEQYVIIFDDLSRFARDLNVHLKLRTELKARNVKLECLNFNFEDSPEGVFIENVLASKAQLDREQNKRQVIQKMKARLEDGFWCFFPPPGLKNVKHATYKRVLGSDEPLASIYKDTIEKYRDGELNTLEETMKYIQEEYKKYNIERKISISGARSILSEVLYAGWIEYKPWGISIKKAKHDGFISIETYNSVQEKLLGKAKVPLRKDYCIDFPLRNFVLCDLCRQPMTASWNKGRTAKYPNYFCKNPRCSLRWKTISKGKIEPHFTDLLVTLTPNDEVVGLAGAIFHDIWDNRRHVEDSQLDNVDKQINELEEQKSFFETLTYFKK